MKKEKNLVLLTKSTQKIMMDREKFIKKKSHVESELKKQQNKIEEEKTEIKSTEQLKNEVETI